MWMEPKIVVGIPAFNEERSIASIVTRSLPHASTVVVIDDGSSDGTSAKALGAGATVIRHQFNSGKGVAIATLFNFAIQNQADVLVLLDGDGQHNPAEIPLLVNRCLAGDADVVVGSRFHTDAKSSTPRIRRLGQMAFNSMTSMASGVRCSDSQSGFRAFNRRAFCSMHLTESSFSVESEMQFEYRTRGLTLSEVPISCSYDLPPKRNVFSHGMMVLSRLASMAIQRRALGNTPVGALPDAPRMVMHGDRKGEAPAFDSMMVTTPGD
jgi:glycosyltransferase involved in cell wall biosynthesis